MTHSGPERRAAVRFRTRRKVKLGDVAHSTSEKVRLESLSMDISEGGLFVETQARPSIGSRVGIRVELEKGTFMFLIGEVVRHQDPVADDLANSQGGIGFGFVGEKPTALLALLASLKDDDAPNIVSSEDVDDFVPLAADAIVQVPCESEAGAEHGDKTEEPISRHPDDAVVERRGPAQR